MVNLIQTRKSKLLQGLKIICRKESKLLFKTFGKIGRTGETGVKSCLSNITIMLF